VSDVRVDFFSQMVTARALAMHNLFIVRRYESELQGFAPLQLLAH
jgi:hypothetical protein